MFIFNPISSALRIAPSMICCAPASDSRTRSRSTRWRASPPVRVGCSRPVNEGANPLSLFVGPGRALTIASAPLRSPSSLSSPRSPSTKASRMTRRADAGKTSRKRREAVTSIFLSSFEIRT